MTRIVVGVDGSPGSAAALAWATRLAGRWSADLEVLSAWDVMAPYMAPHPHLAQAERDAEERARVTLDGLVADGPAGSTLTTRTVRGPAASELVRAAAGADLLVVGAHGAHGIVSGTGSTATRCAVHGEVPTAVIPTEGAAVPDGPVIVGVDGSATGARALRFALRVADADATLIAVNAWSVPAVTGPAVTAFDVSVFEEAGQWALDDTVQALPADDQDRIVTRLRQGGPRSVLREEAEQASLIVVGTEGHSTLLHRLLGSTVTYLLHHHPTPVVVVPAETER